MIFLRANYFRKLSLDEIAKNVLTDKFTLSKEFKKFTGQTIVDYLNGYRIKKAALLIARGSNVSDAAYACGFENMSYFTRLFKSTVERSRPLSNNVLRPREFFALFVRR